MNLIFKNIIRYVSLVLLQVFIINHMNIGFLKSYVSMVIYISFLFTFPVNVSKYILLIVALFLGLSVDLFQNTGGIHASACILLAFIRPFLLRRLKSKSQIDEVQEMNVYTEDIQKYVLYCFSLTLFFFMWLFILEDFSISTIPLLFLKAIASSVVSTFLIILGQYLLIRKPKKLM